MRKNIFRIALVTAFIAALASCKKTDDTTPTSPGTPVLDRDKFAGTWHVTSHHTVTTVTQFWDMTGLAASADAEILFDNFDQIGTGHSVTASVSGSSFTIPQQTAGGETIKGSGTYSNGNLSFTYTADDGVQIDTVSATAHK
jgi:hypothetical protein